MATVEELLEALHEDGSISEERLAQFERTLVNAKEAAEGARVQLETLTSDLAPTPASAWKKPVERTRLIGLPSGNTVEVRVPSPMDLMRGKGLPGPLSSKVAEIAAMAQGGAQVVLQNPEEIAEAYTLIEALCRHLLVSPRVAPAGQEPGEDEIALDWLTLEDQVAIIETVMGDAADALPFPGEPDDGALAGPGGAAVRNPSE